MNKVFLIGRLTKAVRLGTTNNGTKVATFDIAVDRRVRNADTDVDFFTIVSWNVLAENCDKYLFKGSKVAVMGELRNRKYTDSNGITKQLTEIFASDVEFVEPKKSETSPEPDVAAVVANDDNLPF